jgi:predicted nuclease of predicted toxin-antitoxin system
VIVSADTDFGALLAHTRETKPSVILVRALVDRRPPALAGILIANLDTVSEHLEGGAIVAFTHADIRVRTLPLR